jgi:hypothetical protein
MPPPEPDGPGEPNQQADHGHGQDRDPRRDRGVGAGGPFGGWLAGGGRVGVVVELGAVAGLGPVVGSTVVLPCWGPSGRWGTLAVAVAAGPSMVSAASVVAVMRSRADAFMVISLVGWPRW